MLSRTDHWSHSALSHSWGWGNHAVLNHTIRTRGEKEKVSKEEIETQRTKRVRLQRKSSPGLDLVADVLASGEELGNNKDQKLQCTEVHVLCRACLPVFRQCLTRTSLAIGCRVSTPSTFWGSLKQVPLAEKQCSQASLGSAPCYSSSW